MALNLRNPLAEQLAQTLAAAVLLARHGKGVGSPSVLDHGDRRVHGGAGAAVGGQLSPLLANLAIACSIAFGSVSVVANSQQLARG